MDSEITTAGAEQQPAIAQEMGEPYPVSIEYKEGEPRYGITNAEFGLDVYGVKIGFFDKKSRLQGTVELGIHQIDQDHLAALNNAINTIVTSALSQVA